MAGKAIDRFLEMDSQRYSLNKEGKARLFSDEERDYFKAENEAVAKIRETQALKLQIQQETDIEIGLAQAEKKKRSGFVMEALGGVQTYSDPRNWGKGLLKVGNMIIENPKDVFFDAPRGASQAKDATKLFEQSSALNNEATRLAKTDKVRSDELFKQSQELYKSAQEKYGKADENLGQLTTGKQIAAKAALTGLDIGSLLPGGAQIKAGATGAIKGAPLLSKVVTKVPEAVQNTKTFTAGNIFSSLLGLGDIYQGGAKVVSRATGKEAGKGIVGLTTDAIGMGIKNTAQAPVYGTLQAFADNEDDSFENIKNNILTTGVSVFGLTFGFGFAGTGLAQLGAKAVAENAAKKGNIPTPNTPNPTAALGAFNPETDIPMLDLTKTVKGNNIDFNPDSATSVNSTINAVNKLAMLSGNQVGGKAINIDKNSPQYKEIFETMIKPLTDGINDVDGNNLSKIPIEEVELKLNEIETQLKNNGVDTNPISVSDTPNMDIVDEKLARGETPTPEELDKGGKEFIETTGNPEVLEGVKQEVNAKLKESRLYARFKKDNPNIVDPNKAVLYEASIEKENLDFANNLVTNDFDEALRISNSINNKTDISPKETAIAFATVDKLKELGRNDEIADIMANISQKGSKGGAFIQSLSTLGKTDPKKYILEATQARQAKFSQEIKTTLEQVKKELNNVVIDKDTIISILDNITCR
jgi:hypothetical protein